MVTVVGSLVLVPGAVAATPNLITAFAGTGSAGAAIAGSAAASPLSAPTGIATDAAGNVYIADTNNNQIEKVTPSGTLSIIAGTGTAGSPSNGPATSSDLNHPEGVAVDASGNVFIADTGNHQIEKVTPAGVLTIVAGNGLQGSPYPFYSALSNRFNTPIGIAVDSNDDYYVADSANNQIYKITPAGVLSDVAGSIYATAGPPTPGTATSSDVDHPEGLALDSSGNLYVADTDNNDVEKITTAGVLSVIAGTNTEGQATAGPASSSQLDQPTGVSVDSAADLYITDGGNASSSDDANLLEVSGGSLSFLAGPANGAYGAPSYGSSPASSSLDAPSDVAASSTGDVFVDDLGNNTIDRLTGVPPVLSTPPVISGTPTVGQTVQASHGTWNPTPTSYTYQWKDCDASGANCAAISGATQPSYTVAPTDKGQTLRVAVSASNPYGSTASVDSSATALVAAPSTTPTSSTTSASTTASSSPVSQADAVSLSSGALSAGLQASASGVVSVPLECPAVVAGVCEASGTLSISLNPNAAASDARLAHAAAGQGSVIAQFAGVQVQAGQSKLVATNLSPKAIAYLRAHGIYRVRVTLELQNTLVSGQTVDSTQHVWLYVPGLTGCRAATGTITAGVGSLRLGLTRHAAHRTGSYKRSRNGFEHYCIAGGQIRVAYSTRSLARAQHLQAGRIVLALTANHHYAIHGIHAGTTIKAARARLHLGRPVVIGKNAWYFIAGKTTTLVLKAQHGVVREIGITSRAAARTRAQQKYLLHHL